MKTLLNTYRDDFAESVLTFLAVQWARLGSAISSTSSEELRVIDPEPLLLLTLEFARQDPRLFDEVLDWLTINGKWISVTRLTTLLKEDRTCNPSVVGAVASMMSLYNKTPKWKKLAEIFSGKAKKAESLFQKKGKPLFLKSSKKDPIFLSYGLLREPLTLRGKSSSIQLSKPSNLIFRNRALFGVNIRADVFTYLMIRKADNPSCIAQELGYSQRRVQDTLTEMAAANVFFRVSTDSYKSEYSFDSEKWDSLFFPYTQSKPDWFNWRAFSRAITKLWNAITNLREEGLTPGILDSEMTKAFKEAKEDLMAIKLDLPSGGMIEFPQHLRKSLSQNQKTQDEKETTHQLNIVRNAIRAVEEAAPNQNLRVREFLVWMNSQLKEIGVNPGGESEADDLLVNAISKTTVVVKEFAILADKIAQMGASKPMYEIHKGIEWILGYYWLHDTSLVAKELWRFVGAELFAIQIAALLREGHWDLIIELLRKPFYVTVNFDGRPGTVYYNRLCNELALLKARKMRLRIPRLFIHSDILNIRHTTGDLAKASPIEEFMAADFLLYLHSLIVLKCRSYWWFPWSAVFMRHHPPRFLVESTTSEGAHKLASFLQIQSKQLATSLNHAGEHFSRLTDGIDVFSFIDLSKVSAVS